MSTDVESQHVQDLGQKRAGKDRRVGAWVLLATILGSSLAFIDSTVVNVALPVIQTELSTTAANVQWIIEVYALFLAALILVGGSLGDLFGRRRIFALGIILFTLASMWCGLAPGIGQLIWARAIQGVGGALLVPGSLAIISSTFSARQRGRAFGIWSGSIAISTAIGPVLGGWLVEYISWRWVFFINLPLALVVLALLFWKVPESRGQEGQVRLDWAGALLATLGLGGVVYGLIEAQSLGLGHPISLLALLIGLAALALFVLVEARSQAPMLPLELFKIRTFRGTNLLTFFLYMAVSAASFFVPFNLIQVQGYSPSEAGVALLPQILLLFLLSYWAGSLVNRYGARLPLTVGPIIAALGYVLFALPGIGGSYWTTFFPAMLLLGLGMAISVAPLTTAVMGAVDVRYAGVASGINNAVARTAGLLAIALLGLVMLGVFSVALHSQLAALPLASPVRQAVEMQTTRLAGIEIPAGLSDALRGTVKHAIDEAYVLGFRVVMLISAALALASALSAWFSVEEKKSKGE